MSKTDAEDILRRVKLLSSVQPSAQSADRAILRVREALQASEAATRARRRRRLFMRVIMPSSIAASILIGLGVLLAIHSAQPASAAEQLKEVTEAWQRYKGWMKLSVEPVQPQTAQKAFTAVTVYINTEDATWAQVTETDGEVSAYLLSPQRQEMTRYDSTSNQVTVASVGHLQTDMLRSQMSAVVNPQEGMLELLKQTTDQQWKIETKRQGDYEVFIISPPDEPSEASIERNIQRMTIYVDPKTKLVRKLSARTKAGLSMSCSYSYNVPAINSIYDLQVPRTAKVVDNRLSGQTKAVLDRVTARIDKGFGDCVAVMTRSDVTVPGQPARQRGMIYVFAHDGKRWLTYMYRAGKSERTKTYFSLSKLPEGWPRPKVSQVIDLTRHAVPISFFLADGKEAWVGYLNSTSRSYKILQSMTKNLARFPGVVKAEQSLAGKVWPDLFGLRLAAGGRVELLKDDKHPGQVGLRGASFDQVRGDVKQRYETVLWLDPARDDMPVEKTYRSYASDNKTIKNERHTKYLDYSQLPSGRWYPTRWQQTTTYRGADKDVHEYNLQIIPNMKLDDEWFTSPAKRTKTDGF